MFIDVNPLNAIVYVKATAPALSTSPRDFSAGAGVLLSPDTVLIAPGPTSIYLTINGQAATSTNFAVSPGYDSASSVSAPNGTAIGTAIDTTSDFSGAGLFETGYAVIHLNNSFNISPMTLAPNYQGGIAHITTNNYVNLTTDPQVNGGHHLTDGTYTVTSSTAASGVVLQSVSPFFDEEGDPVWYSSNGVNYLAGMSEGLAGLPPANFKTLTTTNHFRGFTASQVAEIMAFVQKADANGYAPLLGSTTPYVPAVSAATALTVGKDDVGGFDAAYYLQNNSDVLAAAQSLYPTSVAKQAAFALQHYNDFGWHEGRNPNQVFNTQYYLSANADVAAAGVNPLAHYETFGWHEGRNTSASFSEAHYLTVNTDVKMAGVNPMDHYLAYGQFEGRSI